jgi:carboxymethylenebutenolidase
MIRILVCGFLLLAACAGEAPAPAPTSTVPAAPTGPVLGENEIAFPSGSEQVVAYIARPRGEGPFPAVVAIHEWWGLNDQIRDTADQLAREGYWTMALDLYRGKVTDNPEQAHELMRGLPEDRALRDLRAAVDYLRKRPEVNPARIGSVGWCMGGGFSVKLAVAVPELAACAVYYGSLPTEPESLKSIQAPVIGFFGDQDEGIPDEAVLGFEKAMRELGKSAEMHIYREAGHAFANPEGKSYNQLAADDSWNKLRVFFGRHLKGV